MANRPTYFPRSGILPGVITEGIPFVWSAGLSIQQKQKNIDAFHAAINIKHPDGKRPLEISSKSRQALGVALSAFNMGVTSRKSGGFVCVESLYQASKVFAGGGPFPALYTRPAREVREQLAIYRDQPLVAFELHGTRWPLVPKQAFYAWLYCQTLHHNVVLATGVMQYDCFTDIEFNPVRSVNCQAYAAAFYVSLAKAGVLNRVLSSKEAFLENYPKEDGCVRESPPTPRKRERHKKGSKIKKVNGAIVDTPKQPNLPTLG